MRKFQCPVCKESYSEETHHNRSFETICDRCGKTIDEFELTELSTNIYFPCGEHHKYSSDGEWLDPEFDLCFECTRKLMTFLGEETWNE